MDPLDALVRRLVADDLHEAEVRVLPVLLRDVAQERLEGRLGELLPERRALLERLLLVLGQAFCDFGLEVVRVF